MMGAGGLGPSGGRDTGGDDGAGGVRDAHAHIVATRQQTRMIFTPIGT
jgi:hypothetical protein